MPHMFGEIYESRTYLLYADGNHYSDWMDVPGAWTFGGALGAIYLEDLRLGIKLCKFFLQQMATTFVLIIRHKPTNKVDFGRVGFLAQYKPKFAKGLGLSSITNGPLQVVTGKINTTSFGLTYQFVYYKTNLQMKTKIYIALFSFLFHSMWKRHTNTLRIWQLFILQILIRTGNWKTTFDQLSSSNQCCPTHSNKQPWISPLNLHNLKLQLSLPENIQSDIKYWTNNQYFAGMKLPRELIAKYNLIPDQTMMELTLPNAENRTSSFSFCSSSLRLGALAYLSVAQYDGLITAPGTISPYILRQQPALPIRIFITFIRPIRSLLILGWSGYCQEFQKKSWQPCSIGKEYRFWNQNISAIRSAGTYCPKWRRCGISIANEIAALAFTASIIRWNEKCTSS